MGRGMTLIETLVVLVLLGMLAGVGAVALAGTNTQASVIDAYTDVLDLDGKARSAALRGESLLLRMHEQRIELVQPTSQETIASRSVNANLTVQWFDAAGFEPVSMLRFDGRGQTQDFQLAIGVVGDPTSQRRWIVSGLTGWPEPMR